MPPDLIFADDVPSTNNTTEYEALLLSLRKMKALGQQTFIIKTDSKVIQEHIEKESEARNPVLEEVRLRRNAQRSDDQGKRDTPISRLGRHLSSLGVNQLDGLGPLRVVRLGLCRLETWNQ